MNKRYLTSTSLITWRKATSWHHRLAMVHLCSRSRKRTAHSESYTTTESSTNIRSSTLPPCQKYRQSSKNSEESPYLVNSTSGQDTTTSAYWRRTHTRQALKQTKGYSNGSSCHLDYATHRQRSREC